MSSLALPSLSSLSPERQSDRFAESLMRTNSTGQSCTAPSSCVNPAGMITFVEVDKPETPIRTSGAQLYPFHLPHQHCHLRSFCSLGNQGVIANERGRLLRCGTRSRSIGAIVVVRGSGLQLLLRLRGLLLLLLLGVLRSQRCEVLGWLRGWRGQRR